MNEELFTVFDSAAKRYLPPFTAQTVEVAIRRFRESLKDPQHVFARFPEDYTLFHIGSFDAEKGLLIPLVTPHSLGVALSFLPPLRLEASNA